VEEIWVAAVGCPWPPDRWQRIATANVRVNAKATRAPQSTRIYI
jgi:hypothetical protein